MPIHVFHGHIKGVIEKGMLMKRFLQDGEQDIGRLVIRGLKEEDIGKR